MAAAPFAAWYGSPSATSELDSRTRCPYISDFTSRLYKTSWFTERSCTEVIDASAPRLRTRRHRRAPCRRGPRDVVRARVGPDDHHPPARCVPERHARERARRDRDRPPPEEARA